MARPVVFPAPAGINRCASYKKLTINSVPRASGDKPDMAMSKYTYLNVFPAPAGINRTDSEAELQAEGVPRASGDKP